jgi:hypothetical protein
MRSSGTLFMTKVRLSSWSGCDWHTINGCIILHGSSLSSDAFCMTVWVVVVTVSSVHVWDVVLVSVEHGPVVV